MTSLTRFAPVLTLLFSSCALTSFSDVSNTTRIAFLPKLNGSPCNKTLTLIQMTESDQVSNCSSHLWNRTNNATDDDDRPMQRGWFYIYTGPLICIFGIVCNALNLLVLSQKMLKESPYSFLTGLALSDMGLLIISLIHLVLSDDKPTFFKAFFDAYIFYVGGNFFFNCSVWITVLLSFERMLFVLKPLSTKSSRKNAWISMVVVATIMLIINLPRLYCFEIAVKGDIVYPRGRPFRSSQEFHNVSWIHAIMINFIPAVLLLATNTTLVYTVHRARHKRVKLNMRCSREVVCRREESRLTITLIAIVIFFFVCTFPSAFVEDPIAYALFAENMTYSEFLRSPTNQLYMVVSNVLIFCNSSMNFIFYCAFNGRFRKAMFGLFAVICVKKDAYLQRIRNSNAVTTYV